MSQLQIRGTCFLLLCIVLPMSGACSSLSTDHPRYQAISDISRPSKIWFPSRGGELYEVPVAIAFGLLGALVSGVWSNNVDQGYQGYEDSQIDGDTYLVTYTNYISPSRSHEQQIDPHDDKWIMGAQEYVLYRAGELAKSKGARFFVVLHQDDWNVLNTWSPQNDVQPGAGLVIRLMNSSLSAMQSTDGHVYDADILLQTLTENNRGLAEYANKTPSDESVKKSGRNFRRWRAPVDNADSRFHPELGALTRSHITKDQTGAFQITTWDDKFWPISSIQFLWQCKTLAMQEGFRTFKVEEWLVKEQLTDGTLWFTTTAKIIPNYQKSPHSIEPVFEVDELFMNTQVKR